jgi:hypothetical protein
MEAAMGSLAQDMAHMGKTNARTFDIASAALSLNALNAGANNGAQMGNVTTQQNEEYSRRKDAGVVRLVALTDLAKKLPTIPKASNSDDELPLWREMQGQLPVPTSKHRKARCQRKQQKRKPRRK